MIKPSLLPVVRWQSCGPESSPRSILRGDTRFFGIPYTATAILVELFRLEEVKQDGLVKTSIAQRGVTTHAHVELEKWWRATCSRGPFETLLIDGKPYVVFLEPKSTTGGNQINTQGY